jgi:G:T-mismatch repair DNA endonuclease (very short patch repair protein)
MKEYKRVKIDSREAEKLHSLGWTIILIDSCNGYILFENNETKEVESEQEAL